jgi:cell division protein FtsL
VRREKGKAAADKPVKRAWRRHHLAIIFAVLLWVVISAFGYVWCRVQVLHFGYLLSEAYRTHSELFNDNTKLHLELARLTAPERVERIAVEELDLRHPDKDQVILLP